MKTLTLRTLGLPLLVGALALGCNGDDGNTDDTNTGGDTDGSGSGTDSGFVTSDPAAALWTIQLTFSVDTSGTFLDTLPVGQNSLPSTLSLQARDESQSTVCVAELPLTASNFCVYGTVGGADTDAGGDTDTDAPVVSTACGAEVDAWAATNNVPAVLNVTESEVANFSDWTDGEDGPCQLDFDEYWSETPSGPLAPAVGPLALFLAYDSEFRPDAQDFMQNVASSLLPQGVNAQQFISSFSLAAGFPTEEGGVSQRFILSGYEVDDNGIVIEGEGQQATLVDLRNSDFLDVDGKPAAGAYQGLSPFLFFAPGFQP